MLIKPAANYNNSKSFEGVKYLNGIETKKTILPSLKEMVPQIESECGVMKNVDVILTEKKSMNINDLWIDVKSPRYLQDKFKQFFEKAGGLLHTDMSECIGLEPKEDKSGEIFYYKDKYNNGMYRARMAKDSYNSKMYYGAVIKTAKIIDSAIEKIKSLEDEYGINFLDALKNVEELEKQANETILYDKITHSNYVIYNDPCYSAHDNIYKLANCIENVNSLKYFKIGIDKGEWHKINSYLIDSNHYIDTKYSEIYKKLGLAIEEYPDRKIISSHKTGLKFVIKTSIFPRKKDCYEIEYIGKNDNDIDIEDDAEKLSQLTETAMLFDEVANYIEKEKEIR